jgi:hypothetical protein
VHDRDGTHTALVTQIRKELRQLHRGEHALVGDGATRQRREVDAGACFFAVGYCMTGTFTQRVNPSVQVDAADSVAVELGRRDEQLRHVRHAAQSGIANLGAVRIHRDLAPAQDDQPLIDGERFDALTRSVTGQQVPRHEADACGEGVSAVRVWRRKGEVHDGPQQLDRQLQQNACPVTAVRLGAGRSAVLEVLERSKAIRDDGM